MDKNRDSSAVIDGIPGRWKVETLTLSTAGAKMILSRPFEVERDADFLRTYGETTNPMQDDPPEQVEYRVSIQWTTPDGEPVGNTQVHEDAKISRVSYDYGVVSAKLSTGFTSWAE